MKRIAVLGSTGSIGQQTLDVVRAFPREFDVVALAAGNNVDLLLQQAREFHPRTLFSLSPIGSADVPTGCRVADEVSEIAADPGVDLVVQGMVGMAGLAPTLAALRAGKPVALANKEPLVIAGELLVAEAARGGGALLPVDSEPSAIWQCLRGEDPINGVRRLVITASGGAFRSTPLGEMAAMTPEAALKHPTWRMGPKVTIDAATLMNKAFEVIEAQWLFSMPLERIDVVIHHQSIVHSMVEFDDGSVKAQLGPTDMRLPIQHALFYPRRLANNTLPRFDPVATGALTFEALDPARYPCFALGMEAARAGGTCLAVLSAADEVAVQAFLQGGIGFLDIPRVVAAALERHQPIARPSLDEVVAADEWAHGAARAFVETL